MARAYGKLVLVGARGTKKGTTSYNGSQYQGTYGGNGAAGAATIIYIGTSIFYALGGSGGAGGEGGLVVGNKYMDGEVSIPNANKCSAPSTSGYTVKASANNMISAGVSASAVSTKNTEANTLIGSTVGSGGAGGTGGQKRTTGTGTHQDGNDGSVGSAGTAGAVAITFTFEN